jgi:chemotaxis protein methyltransferase CheR
MNSAITASESERFRGAIARCMGLHFDDSRLDFLAEVLRRRMESTGRTSEAYLDLLDDEPAAGEVSQLAQELTVGETYFFRNSEQFRAFCEIALPQRMQARAGVRRLHLLSAGCASGEEPYSLAMLARERVPDPAWEVSVQGLDINPAALARARRGRFSSWSLRETTPEVQRRWFRSDGREFVLDESIRSAVRFEERNLTVADPGWWPAEYYDVVFCRNMLMYLTPEHAQRVVERIAGAMAPDGYLFLGHAETLRGLSRDFHLCQTHGTFYYQRKKAGEPQARWPEGGRQTPPMPAPLAGLVAGSYGWVEAIERASQRIHTLTRPAPAMTSSAPSPASARADLGAVIEMLQRERFGEALGLVEGLPGGAGRDPDVLLLRAVLLIHSGQPREAERFCQALLEIDELNAEAHYVLALCREGEGDAQGAIDHDAMAAYLDRTFAMPHLHLGLITRKRGDHQTARRELDQAMSLLQRENPARLLLFGGGFGRESLMAVCRAELAICGGG